MTTSDEILKYFTSRAAELSEELSELIRFDTPTNEVELIASFVRHYSGLLENEGLNCREIPGPAGPQLVAERPGSDPPLILMGHSDTVWPRGEPERRPPRIESGKLFGPGSYDMRAGLALNLWALRWLQAHRPDYTRRIIVFLSADEEKGSVTAREHMEDFPRDATALVPEPPCPDGGMKLSRKGVGIFSLTVFGREVHAGVEPEKGISAISELVKMILEIESWRDPENGRLVNIGTIEGGTATNVVAGRASCGIDFRYDRIEDGEDLERKLRARRAEHADAALEIEGRLAFPPLVANDASRAIGERLAAIAGSEFGEVISMGSSGGGSDGSLLSALGLTVVDGLGVDGAGAHARHEHIVVDRLPFRAALYTRLILELEKDV